MSWESVSIAHPPVGCPQGALGENARDMALIIRRGVNAATGFDHRLHGGCDIADGVFGYRAPNENAGQRTCINGGFTHAAKSQPNIGAFIQLAQRDHGGHADNGKIAAPARDLHETATGARPRQRQFDFNQHFIGPKIRRQRGHEKV